MKMSKRRNPSESWYNGPNYLKNDRDGYLVNPDTNDIYWYHGTRYYTNDYSEGIYTQGDEEKVFYSGYRESHILYASSDKNTAEGFATFTPNIEEDDPELFVVYTFKMQIPAAKIFDIRKAVEDREFKEYASHLFPDILSVDTYEDIVLCCMEYEEYDKIGHNEDLHNWLLSKGFVGWLEHETIPGSLTVALLQEEYADFCYVEDYYTFHPSDRYFFLN